MARATVQSITQPLAGIINSSFSTGIVPADTFAASYTPYQNISVDENMVHFKGRSAHEAIFANEAIQDRCQDLV